MAESLVYLQERLQTNWLIGLNQGQFAEHLQQRLNSLSLLDYKGSPANPLPRILLTDPQPEFFLADFLAACITRCPVFLGNPTWVETEWRSALELVQPDLIWGAGLDTTPFCYPGSDVREGDRTGWIMIPTGGSTGQIRFAIHTWDTLSASVWGLQAYFQIQQINSCCVLPIYHVSGLMQFLRSYLSGGQLALLPFKALEQGELPPIDPSNFFLSLVPTQLHRLLQKPDLVKWLTQFQTILLGGAPAWPDLLQQAREHHLRLAPTYGMTETASQIATLKPNQFLAGENHCGHVLPHTRITIRDDDDQSLQRSQIGHLHIQAKSLALGYYPTLFSEEAEFKPDDIGFFDANQALHIISRSSNKIITGGENVFPEEIEAAIRETQLVTDVAVVGMPDSHWGEIVSVVYIPRDSTVNELSLRAAIQDKLSKFKQPKRWYALDNLARSPQGKINREQIKRWIATLDQGRNGQASPTGI
jgi:O-succinylbenzoic acid--CoA ligase